MYVSRHKEAETVRGVYKGRSKPQKIRSRRLASRPSSPDLILAPDRDNVCKVGGGYFEPWPTVKCVCECVFVVVVFRLFPVEFPVVKITRVPWNGIDGGRLVNRKLASL